MKVYLNHAEISELAKAIEKVIQGTTIDRVIVPYRPYLKKRYALHEWVIRLKSKMKTSKETALIFSTQNALPYHSLYADKGPQAFEKAPTSVFLQSLNKLFKSLKVSRFYALPGERITFLECENTSLKQTYVLITELIPARPNAYLTEKTPQGLKILFQERPNQGKTQNQYYTPPRTSHTENKNEHSQIRSDLIQSPFHYTRKIEDTLEEAEKKSRFQCVEAIYQKKLKFYQKNLHKLQKSLEHTKADPPWGYYGQLLKANLHQLETHTKEHREVFDYEKETKVKIPVQKGKTPVEEIAYYFQKEKRNKRKLTETQELFENTEQSIQNLKKVKIPTSATELSWKELESLEAVFELTKKPISTPAKSKNFEGRVFYSKEGHRILVGRSKEENLKLSFQVAVGNDVWMHLRGRPSAHVVVQVSQSKKGQKKSASLETLLDAATVLIYFSKAQKQGKLDVDYTFRKYVKRIKNSDQVSYTQNKTLHTEFDSERFHRLQNSESL